MYDYGITFYEKDLARWGGILGTSSDDYTVYQNSNVADGKIHKIILDLNQLN